MPTPRFKAHDRLLVRDDGNTNGIDLENAPSEATISAALLIHEPPPDSTANIFEVSSLNVYKRVSHFIEPFPGELKPGQLPEGPQEIFESETLRRVDGAGPVLVRSGEHVEISITVKNLSADFTGATGDLEILSDSWSPIKIALQFFRQGSITLVTKQVDLSAQQGELVSGSVAVSWKDGPPSECYCEHMPISDPGLMGSRVIEMIAPRVVVPIGGSVDIPFILQVMPTALPGKRQIDASLLGGDETPRFDINLEIVLAPPPPPSTDINLGGGYILRREGSILRLTGTRIGPDLTPARETVATVSLPNDQISAEKKDQVVAATETHLKEYFRLIDPTKMTAATAGAALYGAATAAAVLVVIGPGAALPFVGPAAVKLGSSAGEFYGSIVDDVAAVIKGEEPLAVSELIGTMSVMFFTQISPVVQGLDLIRFMGADGWSLTREIGKAVGSALESVISDVGSTVGDIGEAIVKAVGSAIGDAVDFVGDIF